MRRRTFISLAAGAAARLLPSLPTPAPSYWCDCGLIEYVRQPEGYYAGSRILKDGELQRMNYGLHRWHMNLHRKPRMWQLIENGKHRKLTDEEKAELQRLFLRVAENDVRLLADDTG